MSTARTIALEFAAAEALVATLRRLKDEGYSRIEVYQPYASEEIDALLPGPPSPVGWIMLVAGVLGGGGAYFLQWYAARDYPLNVGGRPLHSWPSFVPVTFELTVLSAAVIGVLALLWLVRLPRLDHAMFADPRFARASQDRFFLRISTSDPCYTAAGMEKLLRESGALSIGEVVG
jgi:hypothetical protein